MEQQFTYVKRGYDPEEVNRYITTLEQVIKSYKDKDNAIKNAIISAQIAADNVIRNAHLQAENYKIKIDKQLVHVREAVDAERVRLQAFQDVYNGLIRKYLHVVDGSEFSPLQSKLDELDIMIQELQEFDVVPDKDITADMDNAD